MDDLDSGQEVAPDLSDNSSDDASNETPFTNWDDELRKTFDDLSTDDDQTETEGDIEATPPEDQEIETPEFGLPGEWSEEEQALMQGLNTEQQTLLTGRLNAATEAQGFMSDIQSSLPDALKQHLQNTGISEADAMKELIGIFDHAHNDPMSYLQNFANQMGIDLSQFGQQQSHEQTQEFDDPQVAQMQQQIDQIQQQNQLYAQQQEQQAIDQAQQEVTNFMNEKNEDGKPAYPHFNDVREEMGNLFHANPNLSMKDAYEKAVWSNSHTREQLLKAQADQKAKAQQKQAAEEATKAKKAAKIINSNSGKSTNPAKSYASTEDAIRAAAEEIGYQL